MTSIGVVIPCYKGGEQTLKLISDTLPYVDQIVLVDDKCPNTTGEEIIKVMNEKIHPLGLKKDKYIQPSVIKEISTIFLESIIVYPFLRQFANNQKRNEMPNNK